jgi:hypothetical protein
MAADKLLVAGFAEVILGAVAFFPVSYYAGAMAVWAIKFYGYLHYS